ncbi:helix-turn-helix domain-containing protein [Piscinibacter sp. HJYY11]|jgi:transcriptional regulator with XRE-family HTH domain|uniref:helix-turn-helix domain-containing protein n=1 Tax=Piscinibacter sp. HJYY11 TaxID=2801333 RepID=UPI00191F2CFD|nr:helix-turn-helix domain-containing protein [Piscinibacter sp. HJYY11]MBL0727358.1 helix-turn-helix domain-containing protein [Piscinibacter sp. HJYY11]
MPARAPTPDLAAAARLGALGLDIRARRKALGVSAQAAAEAAGMSRVTWHRIEGGEPSVTMGAYLNALGALGLEIHVAGVVVMPAKAEAPPVPQRIVLADYPQLKRLAWHAPGLTELTPAEALSLYERHWRHLDREALDPRERALLEALARQEGGGRLLV